jgi:hypothetical protein
MDSTLEIQIEDYISTRASSSTVVLSSMREFEEAKVPTLPTLPSLRPRPARTFRNKATRKK